MKIKKLVALVTASALCLGMSMTVFADNSPNEGLNKPTIGEETSVQDPANRGRYLKAEDLSKAKEDIIAQYISDYKEKYKDSGYAEATIIDLATKAAEKEYDYIVATFKDADKALAEANKVLKGYKIADGAEGVVISAADLKLYDEQGNPMTEKNFPKGGITRQIPIAELGDQADELEVGDTIIVLHRTANGVWEAQAVTVMNTKADGQAYIEVHFDSLSPVAFVKLNSKGDLIKVDQAGNPIKDKDGNVQVVNKTNTAKTTTTVATGRSPKTGEF